MHKFHDHPPPAAIFLNGCNSFLPVIYPGIGEMNSPGTIDSSPQSSTQRAGYRRFVFHSVIQLPVAAGRGGGDSRWQQTEYLVSSTFPPALLTPLNLWGRPPSLLMHRMLSCWQDSRINSRMLSYLCSSEVVCNRYGVSRKRME